ncbi:hypothetical protein O3P69_020494 [Scylla paramamosain]|uniref:Secreted protein n=1 Tax=Scylla paramamosain TaxID=85552 RepID=A0AAW0TQB0_SCYPA
MRLFLAVVLIITASLIPHRRPPSLSPLPILRQPRPTPQPFIPQPLIHQPLSLPSPEAPLHPSVSSPSLPRHTHQSCRDNKRGAANHWNEACVRLGRAARAGLRDSAGQHEGRCEVPLLCFSSCSAAPDHVRTQRF